MGNEPLHLSLEPPMAVTTLLHGININIQFWCFVPAKQMAALLSGYIFMLMFVLYVGCCDANKTDKVAGISNVCLLELIVKILDVSSQFTLAINALVDVVNF